MSEDKLQYFVGLDIGTTAVRCVVGELSSDSTTPTVIAFSRAENTGMRKGNVAHIEEVAQAVTAAVQEAERVSGREIRYATVNVNGSHVEGVNSKGVVAISSPDRQIGVEDRMRVEEAATVVQLPANKEIIQVFAKNYRLDGQENIKDPVGMHGVRLEVDTHIVVASTPALKSLEQALERAEMRASHRTVTSLAAAEAILDRKQKESGVAVLDIGAATTNMVVIEDGEVEHIAVIPMGGNHITNDLAIGLKTELDIAELVKLKHASLSKSSRGETSFVVKGEELRFDREMMRMIIEARVEEILDFADRELKRIHRSRKLPGGIVLIGGTAQLPGLVELTKEVMELPARVGNFKHIKRVVDNMNEAEFAPAVGLMLLDMYLGPAAEVSYLDAEGGLMSSVNSSLNTILGRFKKRR
ncbi:MAG TPA: cell division protein FtsA [Candidatus Saccharimonadales bacterium]|nr:cell division protein FtsA [Candidatus Saccharimonadales bacterium]